MIDAFREIRERVSAEDAARCYGAEFDRRGWALCPFHQDRHPSMSFKNGRFRCWVCDLSGDSIDYTARLFGLDAAGAVRRLNEDFRLALPLGRESTREERQAARKRTETAQAHRAFEAWRCGLISRLGAAYRAGHFLEVTTLEKLTEREAVALRMQATFEYWADILAYGPPAAQAQIYRERGAITRWTDRVLNS